MVRQQTPFRFTEREMDIAKGTDLPDLLTHLEITLCSASQIIRLRIY